jgi:ferrochelatase
MNRRGVLLINLGSPDSTDVADVRRYLREFLMDPRVLDAPWPVRFCVVHFAILPKRPHESAEAYRRIWWPEGSPLIVISRRVRAALEQRLGRPVVLAMRYQHPSVEQALAELTRQGVEEVVVVPMFPHYAMSSYESAVERVKVVARRQAPGLALRIVPPYFDDPDYLAALVASAQPYLDGGFDHLLFSFHGIPERHLRKSDPTGRHCLAVKDCCATPSLAHASCYRAQCWRTVEAFVQRAGLPAAKYSVAFQSRLGRDPWLTPYTDREIERLAHAGIKRLLVICPAFVSDCLETLEEIGLRGRDAFRAAGGGELTLIPCLNEHPLWLDALEKLVGRHSA